VPYKNAAGANLKRNTPAAVPVLFGYDTGLQTMHTAMIDNMSESELRQYVETLDAVPLNVVRALMAHVDADRIEASEEATEEQEKFAAAYAEIEEIVNKPLASVDLYHGALTIWKEDWSE
jgi:hypothetical protein